jgi:hypothetical protein
MPIFQHFVVCQSVDIGYLTNMRRYSESESCRKQLGARDEVQCKVYCEVYCPYDREVCDVK